MKKCYVITAVLFALLFLLTSCAPRVSQQEEILTVTIKEPHWHPYDSQYLLHFTYTVKNTGSQQLYRLCWDDIRATDDQGLRATAHSLQHPNMDIYPGETYQGSAEFRFSAIPTKVKVTFDYTELGHRSYTKTFILTPRAIRD